jgi:hypothetical protein
MFKPSFQKKGCGVKFCGESNIKVERIARLPSYILHESGDLTFYVSLSHADEIENWGAVDERKKKNSKAIIILYNQAIEG